jgi:hypothetical protein
VPDVDAESTLQGFAYDRMHAAMLIDKPARMASEGMGQDIARFE